ncbi:MAG: TlpA disulfide reductase family protein [Ginsengibacter sp.]
MKKNNLFLLLFPVFFSFFISNPIKAQAPEREVPSLVFYKSAKGPNWTRQQLDSFLISKNNNRYKLISRVIGTEQKGDTLFYKINLILDPAPVDANNKILAGQQLPDFNLYDINGNKLSSDQLKGKPVVINFWFTECAPCIQEMPALNEIRQKFKDSDVVFLAITFDKKSTVQNFLKRYNFDFTAVPDAVAYCENMTGIFPLTLFVDRSGIIKIADHYMPSYDLNKKGGSNFDISGFIKNIESLK